MAMCDVPWPLLELLCAVNVGHSSKALQAPLISCWHVPPHFNARAQACAHTHTQSHTHTCFTAAGGHRSCSECGRCEPLGGDSEAGPAGQKVEGPRQGDSSGGRAAAHTGVCVCVGATTWISNNVCVYVCVCVCALVCRVETVKLAQLAKRLGAHTTATAANTAQQRKLACVCVCGGGARERGGPGSAVTRTSYVSPPPHTHTHTRARAHTHTHSHTHTCRSLRGRPRLSSRLTRQCSWRSKRCAQSRQARGSRRLSY